MAGSCIYWLGDVYFHLEDIPTQALVFIVAEVLQHRSSIYTSIKIIKNEVGCRDDTVPKTVGTRRHCEEE